MRFVEAQQGTPDWYAARCGRITASVFADAISRVGELDERQAKYVGLMRGGMEQKQALAESGYKAAPTSDTVRRAIAGEDTSAPSDTAKRYAADLAIERISGMPHGEPAKAWVLERGHEMEARARMLYEARTGAFITEAGICVTDDGIFGYSTDGLAGDDGLIEIKAPIDSIKIMDMWRDGDVSEYAHQMQGGMWITGRKWCDFIMYVPDLARAGKDLYIKRVMRDDEFIDAMSKQLGEFDGMVRLFEGVFRAPTDGAVDADFIEVQTTEEPMQQDAPQTILPLIEEVPSVNVYKIADAPITEVVVVTPTEELAPAKASPEGAELSPAAAALLGQEGAANYARAHTPPSLKLGEISTRLGFTVTAAFMESLGFAPAATDKAAKLYHEADFPSMCAALLRHIEGIKAKF